MSPPRKVTSRKPAGTTRKRAKPVGETAVPPAGNGHGLTVAEVAYGLFIARGHAHGHDVEDWLEAERRLSAESQKA